MNPATVAIVVLGIAVAGCAPTHTVAVTSYNAVTAPVRIVHRAIAGKPSETAAANSDVDNPGQPISPPPPTPTPQSRMSGHRSTSVPERTAEASPTRTVPKPSPSPHATSAQPQFPVAKAVPGKPGLVYSPFNSSGALIDVSGYPPGSKVKDPDSQKIFVVP